MTHATGAARAPAAPTLAAPLLATLLLAAGCWGAVPITAAAATELAPTLRCSSHKLMAVGRHAKRALKCREDAVRTARDADACLSRALARQQTAFERAEAAGACLTNGDASDRARDTVELEREVTGAIEVDGDASRVCAARKLRAAAMAARRLLACHAGAMRNAETASTRCLAKVRAGFVRLFTAANLDDACVSADDPAAVERLLDEHTDRTVAALGAICGNGVLEEPLEECDDGGVSENDGCGALCRLTDPSARCAGIPPTSESVLGAKLVADGLEHPTYVAAAPLDPRRLFVVEQAGRIRVVRDGVLLGPAFLDISERVEDGSSEQGLFSVAFDPDYERNGRFFVDYTKNGGDTVVSRFERVTDDLADAEHEKVLLEIPQPYANHNGGQLAFDRAGSLYVGMGDGGSGGDPQERAQDDGEILGKLLRLDVARDTAPYWNVPPLNPDPGAPGPLALVWAKGLRNPWRFSFDRATDDLYLADVGQYEVEEIDVTPAPRSGGDNYGWDEFEGSRCFEPIPPADDCPDPASYEQPVHEYDHSEGCAITGGYVYRGCSLAALRGRYFYSDYCTGFVRTFEVTRGEALDHRDLTEELAAGGFEVGNTSSFGEDARGELYIVDHGGRVWKIVARSVVDDRMPVR